MNNDCDELLKVLIYYDMFQYPLTKEELYERSKLSKEEVERGIKGLLAANKIFRFGPFYSLQNNSSIVAARIQRNQLAEKSIPKARFIAKIVANFPYIRGLFLSGSISKDCMDKDSDIDFFIVAAPNRLWIARLACILFKKIFLLNSTKFFCFNYIIDSDHLTFEDHSLFIATEISTLIPVYGEEYYTAIRDKNDWVADFFPNFPKRKTIEVYKSRPVMQKVAESLFNNSFGDRLDTWLLKKTLSINKKRHDPKLFDNPKYYLNFQKHVAKSHTTDNYPTILKGYRERVQDYTQKCVVGQNA
ncbi:MAG: hypothetical protein U0X91_28425 [Spirosomataceae bacterium]